MGGGYSARILRVPVSDTGVTTLGAATPGDFEFSCWHPETGCWFDTTPIGKAAKTTTDLLDQRPLPRTVLPISRLEINLELFLGLEFCQVFCQIDDLLAGP